jgi:phosphoribosylformimino-5-aminoimidazole carboxamide ribotide isomerase
LKLIPAIDIKNGKSVRLYQGKADTAKIYYSNPIQPAKIFDSKGAEIIHIVDLDAALGLGNNSKVILQMVNQINAKIEVGGGIRDLKTARKYLDNGIERIIIGTAVFQNPNLVVELIKEYDKERIMAAIDHFKGIIKIKGWLNSTETILEKGLEFVENLEVGFILLSSIETDGTLRGPDIEIIKRVVNKTQTPIITAGGIGSIDDIIKLKKLNPYGIIIGRALYENKFSFEEALKSIGGSNYDRKK